jgi:hypothetical protein
MRVEKAVPRTGGFAVRHRRTDPHIRKPPVALASARRAHRLVPSTKSTSRPPHAITPGASAIEDRCVGTIPLGDWAGSGST